MRAKRKTCGVGINDADEKVGNSRFYITWCAMLKRCYSSKYHNQRPTYKDCRVCEEWLVFSKFRAWMEKQDWQGKHLDKDLLSPGNKIYSPDNCVFLEKKVNNFILERKSDRGKYLIGVCKYPQNEKFLARCGGNPPVHLGYYDNEMDAHRAWLAEKLRQAKSLASEQSDPRVARALVERYENYKIN